MATLLPKREMCNEPKKGRKQREDEVSVANSVSRGVKFYAFLVTFHP